MTWTECRDALAKHPREVCCLVAAHIAQCVWREGEDWTLAAAWAIGAARDFAMGRESAADAADADAAANAAYAAYADANAAYAADAAAYAAYAANAAYAAYAAANAAYAAYADANAAYAAYADANAAERSVWYEYAVSLLPPPGKWGPWREFQGLGRAGDYLYRLGEERFVTRAELTQAELVALDGLLSEAA